MNILLQLAVSDLLFSCDSCNIWTSDTSAKVLQIKNVQVLAVVHRSALMLSVTKTGGLDICAVQEDKNNFKTCHVWPTFKKSESHLDVLSSARAIMYHLWLKNSNP